MNGDLESERRPGKPDGSLLGPSALRVLVVDDHPEQIEALRRWLLADAPEWTLCGVCEAAAALKRIRDAEHDAVLLDWHLGDGPSGLDLCREARMHAPAIPIIMLTVEDSIPCRVAALEAGADEFLVKGSITMRELVTRILVVIHRATGRRTLAALGAGPVVAVGPIRVNLGNNGVLVGDSVVELPKHQRKLLLRLARANGDTVSHHELCRAGEITPGPANKNLHNEILRLRHLLGPVAARYVQNARGAGYRLG